MLVVFIVAISRFSNGVTIVLYTITFLHYLSLQFFAALYRLDRDALFNYHIEVRDLSIYARTQIVPEGAVLAAWQRHSVGNDLFQVFSSEWQVLKLDVSDAVEQPLQMLVQMQNVPVTHLSVLEKRMAVSH